MEQKTKENEDKPTTSKKSQTKNELQEKEDKIKEPDSNDFELDITSEYFNPLKALYTPDYRVTERQPKIIYQNMAAFESALKNVGISGLNKRSKNPVATGDKEILLVKEDTTQRKFENFPVVISRQSRVKSKHQRNLIWQMTQSDGPLKQLQQFIVESRLVRVIIRREHGIKGYVEGVLKMFDRHWNMLLVDVLECLEQRKHKYVEDKLVNHQLPQDCSQFLRQLDIKLPELSIKSLSRKRVEVKRRLPQLLLRGEQVVLVSAKESV